MEESEDNMSAEEIRFDDAHIKNKPKKRSIVERELETSLTARVTSPLTNGGATSTSRYGRARRLKSDADIYDGEKNLSRVHKSPKFDRSPSKSAAYKMHASNSPIRIETPKRDVTLENQIENIYNENVSLSRFGSEEKACKTVTKKFPKVYIRKDLIQSKEKEDDTVVLIKNMFSPSESGKKSNTHLSNYMERSSEKYNLNKTNNGYLNTSSVVKTLDFDGKKKRRDEKKMVLSKSELFNLEAQCEYQVGDLAWARMGTYPFWPCIITRDPLSGTFVKKKLYGRIERDVLHVTFFGDNGRRGWIVGTMLRKFLGQMEFEVARNNFPLEAKKKDPRLYAAFFISDKKMPQWQVSVEEAEILLKEPKRLRIDILYEMLQKGKEIKTTPKHEKSKKIVRTNSDVSLSESLLGTLFSEDDTTGKDIERSRSKSGNRSLDVSDVVTACLDNMAAKTGITKIQKQSHMDRWLQKAKSKTPEKSHLQSHLSLKIEKDNKVSNTAKLKKKLPKKSPQNKSCNFRKNIPESQYENENKLLSHQNEHDYSLRYRGNNGPAILDDIEIEYENAEIFTSDIIEPGSGLGIISKVETLYGRDQTQNNDQSDKIMTVPTDKFILSDTNNIENTNIENHVCNNHAQSLDFRNDLICESIIVSPSQYDTKETEIRKINSKIKPIKIETEEFIQATNTEKSKKSETIPRDLKESDCNKSNHYALDDTIMDSGSTEVCDSHIKAMNHACDQIENGLPIPTIEQNMSQIGPTLQTKVELNYGSNLPNISIKTLELKNVTLQNKGPNNFTENVPPTSSNVEKGIENFCNVSSSIVKKTPSGIRDNLIQKKGLDLNYLNNAKKIRIQHSDVIGMKDYIGDGIEEFSDISKNFGKKIITGKATPNKKPVKEANLVQNNELELNNLNTENKITNISLKSSNAPIIDNIKEYADEGIVDLADVSTTAGENNKMMETISLRQTDIIKPCHVNNRHNDLKEFETQLYNIFGLSNKKSPKSKLNLSLSKSSNNNNIIDEKKTIDAGVININKEQSESNQSTMKNKNMYVNSKITNVLVSILEVDPTESKIISQDNHSGKKCADINNSRKNNIVSEADFPDLQNETVETDCNEDKLISSKASIDLVDSDTNIIENRESLTAYDESSKYRHAKTISDSNTEKNEIVSEVTETTVGMVNNDTIENKVYTIEVNSSEQTTSPQKIKSPSDNKFSYDIRKALQNSDFLKYVELKQDALMDEQPALTEVEVTNYLYKTWLYEEGLKTDIKKTDDIQNAKLVNGLKQSPIKIKLSLNKTSKNNKKTYNVQITNDNENFHSSPVRIFGKNSNKNDFITKNKKINDDCANQSDLSLKKSKREKRNSHYNSSLKKYFNSNTKKESYSSKVPELTSNESCVIRSGLCPIVIKENITKEVKSAKDSKTVSSSKSLTQNCFINDQTHKRLHSSSPDKLLPKVSEPVTLNGEYEGNLEKTSLDDSDSNTSGDEEEPVADQLRLSISKNQSAYVADGDINMKNMDIIEEKYETEKDDTDTSVKSDDSEISFNNEKLHTTQHLSNDTREALKNQDFLKYLELKQDTVIDEHPELTEKEVTNYLYKTWLFEESLKNDIKKADDIETVTNLVKGLYQEAAPVKRVRKKKLEKDKQIAFNLDSQDIPRKEKSKRKIIKQYFYKENFSDIEDDVELFEIFKPKSKTPTPIKPLNKDTIQIETAERSSNNQTVDAVNEFVTDELDEVEEYFRQLTAPKPNLFKGLIREKLCEICEKGYNLIKCKGCYCMFHADCVKKKTELVEVASSVRGRKKKKKSRGRKPKDHTNSLDFECQNDERSQDPNASDEMVNTSIENDIEPYVIANADDFETQLSLQMKALLENPDNNMENDSYSSAEELDWNDIDYGQCKIVDVLPRKKDRGNDIDYSNFKCNDCQKYGTPVCFVCKTAVSPKEKTEHRQRCQVAHCQKYYHSECLNHWPQTQFNAGELSRISNSSKLVEALTCPRHVCHTCVCDDPRGCKTRFSGDKLARCVRCPATYHTFTKCLPAGTQILTASHIICPRHYEHRPGTQPRHVNTGWCFICALGGTLICCEYCPTSFHAECLNIDPPEGGYMCEDCETGRLPLYGEMVWVKLGHYRWWPGIILHPSEIPLNIQAVKHSQGEFVVRFFGQYDYYWVNRGRVFPFQEGDSGRITNQKSKIDAAFTMAMEHAQRACEILKTASPNEVESMDIASSLLPPHYVKLKVNKPCGSLCGKKIDIEESSLTQCECDPNEIDPCGPYTQCLNRMLLTECGPTCRAGDRCNNRAFEKRLYPKMTPYRTPARGWGLKVLEDIKAGQFVIEYVGELIDEEEFKRRMRRKQEVRDENFYYLTLDKERMIDAGPKGNLARFMNHSCEPNCETQKWTVLGDVRVGLFAIYDIPANSELTFNYNLESTGIEKKPCMCGAKRCSGYIGEKPKQDDQPKKSKPGMPTKRTYKKRKIVEVSPYTKPKQRVGRPHKPRELTEIEKDLLIIKNATSGMSSDSESSSLLSIDSKDSKGLKRRRTDDVFLPSTKKYKAEQHS